MMLIQKVTGCRKKSVLVLLAAIACLAFILVTPRRTFAMTQDELQEVTSKGWVELSTGNYVYMVTKSKPATGFSIINGRYYYFNEEGYLALGWFTYDKYRYFGRKRGTLGNNLGELKSGYIKAGSAYYYFSESVKAGKHGRLLTGWQKIDSNVYYFQEDGTRLKGLQEINGNLYFFKESGSDKNIGQIETGWKTVNGNRYYFLAKGKIGAKYGSAIRGASAKINGIKYKFDENGILVSTVDNTYTKFINKIGALAHEDMKSTGVLASVTVAQACIESAYGTSILATKANNLFGIKTGTAWKGKSYKKKTLEYVNGSYITVTAKFRKYTSWSQSISDHSAYLTGATLSDGTARYAGLVGCRNYKKAAQIIKNGGYATAPNYVSAIVTVIEKYDLTKFD